MPFSSGLFTLENVTKNSGLKHRLERRLLMAAPERLNEKLLTYIYRDASVMYFPINPFRRINPSYPATSQIEKSGQ